MRSDSVVVVAPFSQHDTGMRKGGEERFVQQLVTLLTLCRMSMSGVFAGAL